MVSSISGKPIFPFFHSSKFIPSSWKAAEACLVGFSKRDKAPRNDVPAFSPSIPLFESKPIADEVSSRLIPNELATGPTYSIATPMSSKPAEVLLATNVKLSVTR